MAKDLELALRIRADLGAARKDIAGLRGDVQKLGGAGGTAAKGLGQAAAGAQTAQRSMGGLRATVARLTGAFAGLGAALSFRAVIAATTDQEAALAQIEARIRSTGGAAGVTTQQLADMAGRLQNVTTFADDQINAMQSVLLTFTRVTGATFEEATEAILDMSQAMGQDLTSTAVQVGKALNDPIEGATALRRVGVQLTDAQEALIKSLVKTGDVAGAQRVILKELSTEFGGAARAARDTFGGALKGLQNAFADLFEAHTGLPAARAEIEKLSDVLADPEFQAAADRITSSLVSGFATLLGSLPDVVRHLREIAPLIGTIGGAFAGGRVGATVGSAFGPVGTGVGGTVGLLAGGIGGNLLGRDVRDGGDPAAGRIERRPAAVQPARPRPSPQTADTTDTKAADQRAKAIAGVIAALREEADTFGLTAEQAQIYRLSTMGATDAQLEQAMALASQITGLRDKEAADKAAAEAQKQRAQESARLAAADREVADALAEELHLITLGGRERAQEEATRRLSAEATDEQVRAVRALAGALYDQQEAAKEAGDQMSEFAIQAARNMQSAFADFLFDPFSEGLQGMLSGFVDVLRRMVSEALAAKLGEALFGSLLTGGAAAAGGAAGGGSTGLIGGLLAGLFHSGGVVGSGGATRNMPALAFAGAPRLHAGGLAADEMPAILRRNEEVLTRDDPRHRFNGGSASPPAVTLKNINLFDTQVIGDYLSTGPGEKAVLNIVSRNKPALGLA